jgi:hypothetical protein
MHFSFRKNNGEGIRGEEKKSEMSEISFDVTESICRLLQWNSLR